MPLFIDDFCTFLVVSQTWNGQNILSLLIFNFQQQKHMCVRGALVHKGETQKKIIFFRFDAHVKNAFIVCVIDQMCRQQNIASSVPTESIQVTTGLPSQSFYNLMRSQWPWFDGCDDKCEKIQHFIHLKSFRSTHWLSTCVMCICVGTSVLHVRP